MRGGARRTGPAGPTGPQGPAGPQGAGITGSCAAGEYVSAISNGNVVCTELGADFVYRDADNDGFGDPTKPLMLIAGIDTPGGYVVPGTDCNDNPSGGYLSYPGNPNDQDGDSSTATAMATTESLLT